MQPGYSQYVLGLDDIHMGSGIGIDSEKDPFGWSYFDGFRSWCEDHAQKLERKLDSI